MKLKTRVKPTHFLKGTKVTAGYIVEVLTHRKWSPIGTDNGITRFETKEAALAKADEISQTEVSA